VAAKWVLGVGRRRRNVLVAPDLIQSEEIRRIVECAVRCLERVAPGSFFAYYLTGSQADGTAVPASDVDLVALARTQESCQAERLLEAKLACSENSPVRVSVQIQNLELVARSQRSLALLRWGSVLLLGEDCRAQLPALDIEGFTREAVSLSRCFMTLGRTGNGSSFPLRHPDEDDEFYGRTQVTVRSLYQSSPQQGTKELIKGILWSVTALLAVQCGLVVGSARQAVERYQEAGGEWWRFVRDSTQVCKHEWNYEVPRGTSERAQLRSICRQLLAFENHCVTTFRGWDLGSRSPGLP
jgi:hypothetical protein